MRFDVDFGLCEANGICSSILPEVFHLGDDDVLTVLKPSVEQDEEELVAEAIRQCPRQAIFVVD